ncbi:Ldh family oxidoreductase [Phreatobacter stygius]|uniref:Ldh family oxidoreductase n=1 Tax=Phreatobacter stygius TaxID=1940610 RepID=A0A4D7BFH8_9HYPH|nr:Ldh family oxidoreductase [Phreatobacter stygius]QCI66637.1 Ldh family oxidoreductase [Phreatobacter stygius]
MTLVPLDTARAYVAHIFRDHGASETAALSVAAALVGAEADGLKGHGLSRIPTYLGMLASGKIRGDAVPTATRIRTATLMVDAADGFAYSAIDLAVAQLPDIVRETGIAAAAITRSNHAGALGHHVERFAAQGLVALFFANTPEAIAPAGGTKAVYGTNPIAFAAPLPGRPPVVVDLALSTVARGNIVAAKQKGEAIPTGWALDAEGKPTTDADQALKGTMVALGGPKGTALALMVEVLAAALTGAHLSMEASSFLDEKGPPPGTGQTILAIDPAGFGHGAFGDRMTALAGAIEAQAGARLPGQRRLALRQAAAAQGIVIPTDLIQRFGVIG